MIVFLKARAKGWMETQVNGFTLIRFADDTIELEHAQDIGTRSRNRLPTCRLGIRRY
jgi:hypothetical protein